jgi:ABC-type transporter Mla subunit MlaD
VPLREGDQLLGRDPPSIDRVLQRTWDNLNTVGDAVDELRPEIAQLRGSLDTLQATIHEIAPEVHFRDDLDALAAEAARTYDALGDRRGLDRIGALVDHTHATLAQARAMIATLRTRAGALSDGLDGLQARLGTNGREAIDKVELAIDRVKAVLAKVDPLLAQVEDLQQRLARGEGSLMKLMHDPEFPEDAKELGKIMKRQPWKLLDHP